MYYRQVFKRSCHLGPVSLSEYVLEHILEQFYRRADWLAMASGGYASQSARGF